MTARAEEAMLPEKTRRVLESFVNALRDAYGDGLRSVSLYGSTASGEFVDRHSNINLLVILGGAGGDDLSKARPYVNSSRYSRINPIFMSEEFLRHSSDVFPAEFLDMKENYTVLYGADMLKDLAIDSRNLRFQCEHELKSVIINLKRLYLKGSPAELERAVFRAATSSMHILRSFLKSNGVTPQYGKEAALQEIAGEFKLDMAALRRIMEAKRGIVKLGRKEIDPLCRALVQELEAAAAAIDRS